MMTEFTSINISYFPNINKNPLSYTEENSSSEEMLDDEKINNVIFDILNDKCLPSEEDKINFKDLYIVPKKKNSFKKKDKFIIVNESTKLITQLTKRKRGKQSNLMIDNTKTHDRFSLDNVLAKVKNHSLSFVVNFLNIILKILLSKEVFLQLNHEYKKNIQNFSKEKKKTLGEIIYNKISPKYHCDENWNINTYDKVKEHEIFKKILNMDYITFFRRYYMESKKCINLKDFGLENEVILSEKCKMFNDLIKKIKNSNNEDNENYIKSIKKCINKNYIAKKLFKTSK
jgi:hypothetical protein